MHCAPAQLDPLRAQRVAVNGMASGSLSASYLVR